MTRSMLGVFLVLLAGCGGDGGPAGPNAAARVSITPTLTKGPYWTSDDRANYRGCDYTLVLTATGGATLTLATLDYQRTDIAQHASAVLTPGQLAEWFGATHLDASHPLTARRFLAWTVTSVGVISTPTFRTTITLQYTTESGTASQATTTVGCGA